MTTLGFTGALGCRMYTMFDALADKHGVYKVDTIGDGKSS